MVNFSKYEQKSFFDQSSNTLKKINQSKFEHYKNPDNKKDQRYILELLDNNVKIRLKDRKDLFDKYCEIQQELWDIEKDKKEKGIFFIPRFRSYTDEELEFLSVVEDKKKVVASFCLTKNYSENSFSNYFDVILSGKLLNETKTSYYFDYSNVYVSPFKLFLWKIIRNFPENFWYLGAFASKLRSKKRFVSKCPSATQTVSG